MRRAMGEIGCTAEENVPSDRANDGAGLGGGRGAASKT